ncbi:MAG: phytanoyl-CoA dioxygenase family protein [Pirellulaceae bacterium]|nr:phytanoyl-CoA dioxygenase family protein [Pirellulaceae bacterium]
MSTTHLRETNAMTFTAAKADYDKHGFVILRQFLNSEELAELRENLERYIRDVVPGLPDADAFYQDRARPETLKQMQRMGCDEYFLNYAQHPKWHALAEALVGEPVICDQPEWFNKPPGTNHVTPPHQDNFYFCLKPSNVVTIWLALDATDAENGCLRYVDGSHLQGYRTHAKSKILGFSQGIVDYRPDDFTREVPVPLQPGDAVAHHGMTIHRADANMSSTRHRRSFALVLKGQSCTRDEAAYERYMQSAQAQHQEFGLVQKP